MRRILSILLVTVVMLVMLSGCGGGGGAVSTSPPAAAPASRAEATARLTEKTSCEGGAIVVYYCGPEEVTRLSPQR